MTLIQQFEAIVAQQKARPDYERALSDLRRVSTHYEAAKPVPSFTKEQVKA